MIANRIKRLTDLQALIDTGSVDKGVIEILELINSHPEYLTTSSCSGRIQLLELPDIGEKRDSNVIAKWHDLPLQKEFGEMISSWSGTGALYVMLQSPIFHIEAIDLESAVKLRNLAQEYGFKYSTIRSIKLDKQTKQPIKITVEILASDVLHVPLGESGTIHTDSRYIDFLFERITHHFLRSQRKLDLLKKGLSGLYDPNRISVSPRNPKVRLITGHIEVIPEREKKTGMMKIRPFLL